MRLSRRIRRMRKKAIICLLLATATFITVLVIPSGQLKLYFKTFADYGIIIGQEHYLSRKTDSDDFAGYSKQQWTQCNQSNAILVRLPIIYIYVAALWHEFCYTFNIKCTSTHAC